MAVEDILIKMMANTQEALRQWEIMKRGPEGFGDALERTARKGKRSSESMAASADQLAKKWVSINSAIGIATQAIQKFRQESLALRREQADVTVNVDESMRPLMQQLRLTQPNQAGARKAVEQKVFQIAGKTAAPGVNFAATAARHLASVGFSQEELLDKGGLKAFLDFLGATAARGRDADPQQLARAVGGFIKSTGQPMTTGSLRKTTGNIFGLFENKPLEAGSLPRFTKASGMLKELGGVSPSDQLAFLSTLMESGQEPAEAATSMRNLVVSLTAPNARGQKALKGMGVGRRAVDLQGESLVEAVGRIRQGIGGMRPGDRPAAMRDLVGREGLPALQWLVSHYGDLAGAQAAAAGGAGPLEDAAALAREGPAAERNIGKVFRQSALRSTGAAKTENRRDRLRSELLRQGASPAIATAMQTAFDTLTWLGVGDEAAIGAVQPPQFGLAGDVATLAGFPHGTTRQQTVANVMNTESVPGVGGGQQQVQVEVTTRLEDPDRNAIPAEIDAAQLAPQ